MIPKPPLSRPRRLPPPAPRRSARHKLHHLLRRHEREERPFDPEKPPTWRGSSKDLVANPAGFERDLRQLVSEYYPKLRFGGRKRPEMTEEEVGDELVRAFREDDTEVALDFASSLLDGFGVEGLGPVDMHEGPPYLYVNFGDPYLATIMWSRDDNKVFVAMGGWGDVWEGKA